MSVGAKIRRRVSRDLNGVAVYEAIEKGVQAVDALLTENARLKQRNKTLTKLVTEQAATITALQVELNRGGS